MVDLEQLDRDIAQMFLNESEIRSGLSIEQARRVASDEDIDLRVETPPEPPKPEPKFKFEPIAHDFRRRWGLEK